MPNKCLFKAPGPRSDSDIYSLFWVITTTVETFLELDQLEETFSSRFSGSWDTYEAALNFLLHNQLGV